MADTFVYWLQDADGALLYVGMTGNVAKRVRNHTLKHWGGEIASVTMEAHADRRLAAVAERHAIRVGRPKHNERHLRSPVLPNDLIERQRIEWGNNIDGSLHRLGWTRHDLVEQLADAYGLEVSLQAVGYWINGDTAPNPVAQSALAGVFQTPHHLLFPPIQLERRPAAA